MIVKGLCAKCETLSDGSIKLSIYVNKEDISLAFPLAYKEVYLSLEESQNKADILTAIKSSMQQIAEILEREFKND